MGSGKMAQQAKTFAAFLPNLLDDLGLDCKQKVTLSNSHSLLILVDEKVLCLKCQ